VRREPLIIGGGPAGTAAAIRLGEAGYEPRLIERCAGPADKVCGDFLGADAITRLRALGVDPASLGAAPIQRLRLVHRDRVTEAELPFFAVGLSRRVLDEALLRRAEVAGARLVLGQMVRRITRGPSGWLVDTGENAPITAADVFLATGKHDVRDLPRPGVERGTVGMKMYFRLSPAGCAAQAGVITLILFPGGYAGLQCVEAGRAALCVALSRARFRALGGSWSAMVAALASATPHMQQILAGATPLLPRPLAVAGVPYGFLYRRLSTKDADLFRLGDQVAVIPSLTGDGIAIALHSGVLAAQCWQDGDDAVSYQHRLVGDLGSQMRLAALLHKAATAGPLQGVAIRGAAWFPGLLRQAARTTRVRRRAPPDGSGDPSGSPTSRRLQDALGDAAHRGCPEHRHWQDHATQL